MKNDWTKNDWTGTTIYTEIFTGNYCDIELRRYEDILRGELAREFPGATIEIEIISASGIHGRPAIYGLRAFEVNVELFLDTMSDIEERCAEMALNECDSEALRKMTMNS